MVKRQLKETDLYHPVRDFLEQQGYLVRSEVLGCDITASKDDQLLIVELKLTLNTTLLVQALDRQRLTDQVYVALPQPSSREWRQRWPGLQQLLRRLSLGLLLVSFTAGTARVQVVFEPGEPAVRKSPRRRQAVLCEMDGRSGEYNLGGSNRRPLLTAYRERALYIAWQLERLGPQSPKALRQAGTCQETQRILYQDHYGWFDHVKPGVYAVNESGRQALQAYADLTAGWQ